MYAKSNIARYENIAYQIASKIYDGEIPIGSKLSGRTLLSSEYNVSSETIRRAVQSLVKYDVVKVKEQSGVFVISKEQAKLFLDDFEQKRKQKNLKRSMLELIEEEAKIHRHMEEAIKELMYSKELFPFDYFSVKIRNDMNIIGKSLEEVNVYEKTCGLLIAYEYDHILYQIPDPKTIIKADMIFYIMGDLIIKKKVNDLLAKNVDI